MNRRCKTLGTVRGRAKSCLKQKYVQGHVVRMIDQSEICCTGKGIKLLGTLKLQILRHADVTLKALR